MSSTQREYEIILYGATGYTGKLTAEQITLELPTDLRWAVSGRTASKLEALVAELQTLNPNRLQPALEPCTLAPAELDALAKRTACIISIVGPYSQHGEGLVAACAANGTHYVDVTGEVPWHAAMLRKYERAAQASGAIMIPQAGLDSTPADLMAWVLANTVRDKLGKPTAEVVVSLHDAVAAPSGGSIGTILSLYDVWTKEQVASAQEPYALSPTPGPKQPPSLLDTLFGVRSVRGLGTLATSVGGLTDEPVVQRTWGLLKGAYGPNFQFREMGRARNWLTGTLMHWAIALGRAALRFSSVRNYLKKKVPQPGDGPSKEAMKMDYFEYRGVGVPEGAERKGPRAFCKVKYNGPMYVCEYIPELGPLCSWCCGKLTPRLVTGLSVAMAAISILRDDHKELSGGGFYTPAMLGQAYVDRLDKAGFKWEIDVLDN